MSIQVRPPPAKWTHFEEPPVPRKTNIKTIPNRNNYHGNQPQPQEFARHQIRRDRFALSPAPMERFPEHIVG
jgi:hypothetical protein